MHAARHACARLTYTKSTLQVTAGTMKKSQKAKFFMWLFRKAFQVNEDGLQTCDRYGSTVNVVIWIPNVHSSPTRKGNPQIGFDCHMS